MNNFLYNTKYVAAGDDLEKSFMDQVIELTQDARKRQAEIMQLKLERELGVKKPAMKPSRKIKRGKDTKSQSR